MTWQAADVHMSDEVIETVNHVIRLTLPLENRASSAEVPAPHRNHRRTPVTMVALILAHVIAVADQVAPMMAGVVARIQVELVGLVVKVVLVETITTEFVHTVSQAISVLAQRVGSVGGTRHPRMTPIAPRLKVRCTLTKKGFKTMTMSNRQKE